MAEDSLHEKLASTAKAHVLSCLPQTMGSNDASPEEIHKHLAPDFKISWGHSMFVANTPPLQGEKTGEGFISHLQGMAKSLQTWRIDITDVCVDVPKRKVVLRTDFHMVPKGGEEVLNEIIFWMVTNESGDKLVRCTEFVDPVAGAELAARMKAGMEK